MGVLCGFSDLKNAIVHDVNTLERYDDEVAEGHVLSVIIFKNDSEMASDMMADILKKASRKSDMVFYEGDVFAVMMPATNKEGAEYTFSQLHEVCKALGNLTTFTYPADAFTDDEFYEKVRAEITVKQS